MNLPLFTIIRRKALSVTWSLKKIFKQIKKTHILIENNLNLEKPKIKSLNVSKM